MGQHFLLTAESLQIMLQAGAALAAAALLLFSSARADSSRALGGTLGALAVLLGARALWTAVDSPAIAPIRGVVFLFLMLALAGIYLSLAVYPNDLMEGSARRASRLRKALVPAAAIVLLGLVGLVAFGASGWGGPARFDWTRIRWEVAAATTEDMFQFASPIVLLLIVLATFWSFFKSRGMDRLLSLVIPVLCIMAVGDRMLVTTAKRFSELPAIAAGTGAFAIAVVLIAWLGRRRSRVGFGPVGWFVGAAIVILLPLGAHFSEAVGGVARQGVAQSARAHIVRIAGGENPRIRPLYALRYLPTDRSARFSHQEGPVARDLERAAGHARRLLLYHALVRLAPSPKDQFVRGSRAIAANEARHPELIGYSEFINRTLAAKSSGNLGFSWLEELNKLLPPLRQHHEAILKLDAEGFRGRISRYIDRQKPTNGSLVFLSAIKERLAHSDAQGRRLRQEIAEIAHPLPLPEEAITAGSTAGAAGRRSVAYSRLVRDGSVLEVGFAYRRFREAEHAALVPIALAGLIVVFALLALIIRSRRQPEQALQRGVAGVETQKAVHVRGLDAGGSGLELPSGAESEGTAGDFSHALLETRSSGRNTIVHFGRDIKFEVQKGDDNSIPRLLISIWLDEELPGPIIVRRMGLFMRLFRALDLYSTIPTGDDHFDRRNLVQSPMPKFAEAYLSDPVRRAALKTVLALASTIDMDEKKIEVAIHNPSFSRAVVEDSAEELRRMADALIALVSNVPTGVVDPPIQFTSAQVMQAQVLEVFLLVLPLIGFGGTVAVLIQARGYDVLAFGSLFFYSLRYGLVAWAVFLVLSWLLLKGRKLRLLEPFFVLFTSLCLFPIAYGISKSLNGRLDQSPVRSTERVVLAKEHSKEERNRDYRITVEHAADGAATSTNEIGVDGATFEAIAVGKTRVLVSFRSGYLGFPWGAKAALLSK